MIEATGSTMDRGKASSALWWRPIMHMYEFSVLVGGIAIWAVGGTIFSILGLFSLLLPRGSTVAFGRAFLLRTFRFFIGYLEKSRLVRFDWGGLTEMGDTKATIIAPNHLSLLDAVFIFSHVPNVVCIMKSGIRFNPFLAGGARLAGFINNAPHTGMVKNASEELKRGANLLIFPEGTRTRREADQVNAFKGGFALIAKMSGATIQPVFLRSNTWFLEKGWSIFRKPKFPLHYTFELGDPCKFPADAKVKDFVNDMEEMFREELRARHRMDSENPRA